MVAVIILLCHFYSLILIHFFWHTFYLFYYFHVERDAIGIIPTWIKKYSAILLGLQQWIIENTINAMQKWRYFDCNTSRTMVLSSNFSPNDHRWLVHLNFSFYWFYYCDFSRLFDSSVKFTRINVLFKQWSIPHSG